MDFQKNNKWFFTACEDGTLKTFDFKGEGFQREYENAGVQINCAVLHPNEIEIIFGDQNGDIKVWHPQIQKATTFYSWSFEQYDLPSVSITALEISKDASKLIMGNSAGFFCFWDSDKKDKTEDFKPIYTTEAHNNTYILKCKLSSNKRFLATCSADKSCKIWQYNPQQERFDYYQTLSGHHHWVWDCDFTVDCQYCLTVSTD